MPKKVRAIPVGQKAAIPSLAVKGGKEALAFYKKAFGATVTMRFDQPDGRVGHAELRIGDAAFFLADEFPERDFKSPQSVGGTPVTIHVFVEDVDKFFRRATRAGAKVLRPVEDQFYGDRSGQLEDPFGHRWSFATHIEDVSVKEMQARMKKLLGGA